MWLTLLQAMRRVQDDLHEVEDALPQVRRRRGGTKPGSPVKFATHRDPEGRFELRYPAEWELQTGHGVLVRSKRIASFANVETVAGAEAPWMELEESVKKLGGELEVTRRLPGPPRQLRGRLRLGPSQFLMNAWAHEVGSHLVVLTTANVVDPERSTKIERYEDKVLAAIRREFRAPARPTANAPKGR